MSVFCRTQLKSPPSIILAGAVRSNYSMSLLQKRSLSCLLAAPDVALIFIIHIPLNSAAIARPDGILVILASVISSLVTSAVPRIVVPTL